jgi:predicted permease
MKFKSGMMLMNAVMEKIIPVILVFVVGFTLKKAGILTKKDADSLLKVFFYVSIPALIFLSVSQMKFSYQLLWLPVIAVLVILINFAVSHYCGRFLKLDQPTFGVFLIGSLIMNTSFTFPFLMAAKGEESLAQASLFDFGNTALVFTFIYYLACKYGTNSSNMLVMIGKFVRSPPLLALIVALCFNLAHFPLPTIAINFFSTVGYLTTPLVMLTLGIYFTPKAPKIAPVFSAVFIRTGIGLLLGLFFVYLLDLKGLSRTVVLVCSSAPSGLNTLVFSSMEKLDNEFAASIVSYSVVVGMFLIPLLLQVFTD